MLNRTVNLTRSALTNFVRHHSHGGIPGEVRTSPKVAILDYATFSMRTKIDFPNFSLAELALLHPEQIQADSHVHRVLRIGTRSSLPRPQTSIVEEVNSSLSDGKLITDSCAQLKSNNTAVPF